jgi:tetratricopeptide (TPR) repeat protein
VLLSFWIEGRLGGWGPMVFHATNVLLHAGVTLLLGLLVLHAGVARLPALAGTLWFAVMPAHLEAVAWILGRTDLLCAGCALLALWLDRRDRARGRRWPGVPALAAFTASLLSKEAAASWAMVIAAAEWVRGGGIRERARWVAPYLAVTALWLGAHALAAGSGQLPAYVDQALRARRQAAAFTMAPQYLSFLWPWYPHSSDVAVWLPPGPFHAAVVAGAVLAILATAAMVVLARRRSPFLVPAAIVVAPVLPSLAVALARAYVTSGERMVYLSSAGVAWLAATGLAAVTGRARAIRWATFGAAAVLIAGSAVETLRVQPSWADDARVFRAMTARQPDNPAGWVGLADALARGGRRAEAEAALDRAEAIAPRLPAVEVGRAALRYRHGEWESVIAAADRALALDDAAFQARSLRASTLLRLGRTAEAARDIERLRRDRPDDPTVLAIDGQRLMAEGRHAEAAAALEAAARVQPRAAALWFALGRARAAAGDLAAARQSIERGLEIEPRQVAGWVTLARLHAALGDSVAAQAALDRARALRGGRRAGAVGGPP